jgi:hypothetical protein
MPGNHSLGFNNGQNVRPSRPELTQGGPEETIEPSQRRARPFPFEDGDLLAQREDFDGRIRATTEETPTAVTIERMNSSTKRLF